MSSYIYMKILESQPERYDYGISMISLGKSERFKERLVEDSVRKGMEVLEIGCGTGTMSVLAAKKGARVQAFDVSDAMLEIARRKVSEGGLEDSIELREMGVSGLDHYEDGHFDLVMSTLVFSELSADEQNYALKHAHRVLKPGGRLAVADEARPSSPGKRFIHSALRLPLLLLTFALTQTTTKAIEGLPERVKAAGFRIDQEELSAMDSFLYLLATRE